MRFLVYFIQRVLVVLLLGYFTINTYASVDTPATEGGIDPPKKVFSQSNVYDITLRIQTRLLFLGSQDMPDRNKTNADLQDLQINENKAMDLRFRRLRIGVKGEIDKHWFYTLDLRAETLINTNKSTPEKNSGVHQVFMGYRFHESVNLTIGSFIIPFSREWLTSSGQLTSFERSVAANQIVNNYDTGIMLDGSSFGRQFYYAIGLFSGAGGAFNGQNGHPTTSPMSTLRLQFDPLGEVRQGKHIFSHATLLSFGGGVLYQHKTQATALPFLKEANNSSLLSATIDATFVWNSIATEAAWFISQSASYSAHGWHIMPSFMIQDTIQAWVKFESWFNSHEQNYVGSDLSLTRYISWGLNYYPGFQHNVKIQAGYYMGLNRAKTADGLYTDAGIADDWGGLQMQVSF